MGQETEKRILLHFVTKFMTKWGQNVVVTGAGAHLGDFDIKRAHWASCHHAGSDLVWEVIVPAPLLPEMTYRYAVVDGSGAVVAWERRPHILTLPPSLEDGAVVEIHDEWVDRGHPAELLGAAPSFARVVLPPPPHPSPQPLLHLSPALGEAVIRFQVCDWELHEGQEVCVTGGAPQLGNWQIQQVLQMSLVAPGIWEAEVMVPLSAFPVTYKYAVGDCSGQSLSLEHGESRLVALPMTETSRAPALLVRHDGYLRRERRWKGAGVAVPVFSLRTAASVGCGEFSDIPAMAQWCSDMGLCVLQLLPVADTSVRGDWRDSYPYSSVCVFALHPLYLCLSDLASPLPQGISEEIDRARAALDGPEVDYEATLSTKLCIARRVYDAVGKITLETPEFKQSWKENEDWLRPYAVFCFLRDMFGTAEHWRWGALSGPPSAHTLDRLSSPNTEWYPTLQFHYYIQYHLHLQLAAASREAAAVRVALKGDLPIGVDKRSVDTWLEPTQFRMDTSTGAPPDCFDPGGQNWGFPTYNWEEMEADGFRWWKRRLEHMSRYFHAYRIDHILGFFRIWELPAHCRTGLLGRFRPSVPLWRNELESRGIWDFDRLRQPYVTRNILKRTFGRRRNRPRDAEGDSGAGGAEAAVAVAAIDDDEEDETSIDDIISRYFEPGPGRRLLFRPEFATEAALWAIRPRPSMPKELAAEVDATRQGLVSLFQNVILIRDPEDPERFYPRFALTSTSSFRELESHWREQLSALHDDYYHGNRSDAVWTEHATKTLPVLQNSSDMLVCGEDLGMIPGCVHPIMESLGIVGLRIQRMPSDPGVEFGDPSTYPYMCVASPSSHDTTTLRAWYQEDSERRRRFFVDALGGEQGEDPELCEPTVVEAVIRQHMESNAALAIFPLQDLMALSGRLAARPAVDETINDPTNSEHYWRYRMHVAVEELSVDPELKERLSALLAGSERGS